MDFLIFCVLVLILLVCLLQAVVSYNIEKWLAKLCDLEPAEDIDDTPTTTDSYQKPKELYSSTTHIIVPRTPTEIRNRNYDKLKEGLEYGDKKK